MSTDSNKDTNTDNNVIDKVKSDVKAGNSVAGEANVAETLNEIFDDDPAKKAREKEIAKYEKKRQKALEREAKKAAKAEKKQKAKDLDENDSDQVSSDESKEEKKSKEINADKASSAENSTASTWSWDKAVKESSRENESGAQDTSDSKDNKDNDNKEGKNIAVSGGHADDGELDEAAMETELKKKLRAEKKAEKKLKKEQKKADKEVNIVKDLLFLCMYILIVIGICWAMLTYVGQRTEVSGESMSNTLHSGDTLWIDKLEYEFGSPKRFDVVVFPYGDDEDTFYIKRIIGMPGETVYIDEDGTIYINDEPLEGDKYGREVIAEDKRGIASEEITLGDDEYFVLGDNRNNSRDSRVADVGNIHKNDIIGRAVFRFTGGFGKIE